MQYTNKANTEGCNIIVNACIVSMWRIHDIWRNKRLIINDILRNKVD